MSEIRAKMGLEAGAFETGLQRVKSSVASFASSAAGMFAGAFGIGAIISGFKQMVTELDKVANTARAFGVNVEDFQRFQYAIAQTGGSAEGLAKALRTLAVERAEALADSASRAATAFSELGISADQVKSLSLGELFQVTRNRLSEISNEADRAAVAQEVLGRASLSMASSLEVSSDTFNGFVQQAVVASEAAVKAGDTIDDAFTALGGNFKRVGSDIVEALSPVILFLTAFADHAINSFRRVQDYAGALGSGMVTLFKEGPSAALQDFMKSDREIMDRAQADLDRAIAIYRGEVVKRETGQTPGERKVDVSRFKTDVQRLEQSGRGKDSKDLDAQEEINAARAENRALIREAQRERDRIKALLEQPEQQKSSMEIFADSLQRVGGGGRVAQVGGVETVQRDIAKNTRETAEAVKKLAQAQFGGLSPDIGAQ